MQSFALQFQPKNKEQKERIFDCQIGYGKHIALFKILKIEINIFVISKWKRSLEKKRTHEHLANRAFFAIYDAAVVFSTRCFILKTKAPLVFFAVRKKNTISSIRFLKTFGAAEKRESFFTEFTFQFENFPSIFL